MKIAGFAVIATLLASSTSFATSYIKCGDSVDWETMEAVGYKLELSSQDDNYTGPVGKNWSMKLYSEDSEWLAPSKNVVAKTVTEGDISVVEIKMSIGKSVSGTVGSTYRLIDLYSEEPTLEVYTMGGFVGKRLVGTYQCAHARD